MVEEEPRADVDRRPRERSAEGAHHDAVVGRLARHRIAAVVGLARHEHAGLLPRMADVEPAEALAQHVVHAERHVLDAPAGEDDDLGRRMRGDEPRDVAQRLERPGQANQHHSCATHEVGPERERRERVGESEPLGVGGQRSFAR